MISPFRRLFIRALTVAFASIAALGAFAPLTSQTLPTDSAVRIGTLPNGMRYYIRRNVEPQKRAELRLVVNAGSVLEDDDQRGLAHLLEHMAFNGTRNFEKQELVRYLESVGTRFGADLNASTSFDETIYMLTVPTDSVRLLETGFQVLEDWAHGITLDSAEVEKERGVVIEEWRLGRGASARLWDKQAPVVFQDSRYAVRLPIGTLESLQTARPSAVRRFYSDWYRPDLMAVIAVGDFDPTRVETLIREHFSRIPAATTPRPRPLVPVPDNTAPLVTIATDPETPYTQVQVLYKHPLRVMTTAQEYRRLVVEGLYNGMFNERLAEMTRRPDPPFAYAGSGAGTLVRSKEAYSLSAVVSETGVERGLDALLTEAERVARHGFTSTELEREKASVLRAMERAFAEREKAQSGGFASEYIRHFLEAEPIPGIAYEYQFYQQVLPGITLEDVNALAREWLTDQNRVVIVSAPEKAGVTVPAERSLLSLFDAVEGKQVAAYVDAVNDAPLLERPARPGTVTVVRQIPEVGVTEWRLSNGIRVLLKPTDFRADQVAFTAYSLGGSSLTEERDHIPTVTLNSLVSQAARLGTFDPIELRKRLADKVVSVTPSVGLLEETIGGSASPKDLETMFQLIHLYFTAVTPDTGAFEGLRNQLRGVYQNMAATPEAVFADSFQVLMARHHPRARPFTAASIEEMDLNRSFAIYRDRFADAGDFTFTFVGNFQPDSLRPLVESYLATLPATGRRESWRDLGLEYPTGIVRKEVRKGVEPKSQTRFVFSGPVEYNRPNLHLLSSLADVLRARLRDDLREELGATYGVSVSGAAAREPKPIYRFDITFGADPSRRDELVRRVLMHVDSLRRTPPSAAEVAAVQEQQRRALETSVRENGYWLGVISAYDRRGWDIRDALAEEGRIRQLRPEDIQAAAGRFLNTANYVEAWLLPEATSP